MKTWVNRELRQVAIRGYGDVKVPSKGYLSNLPKEDGPYSFEKNIDMRSRILDKQIPIQQRLSRISFNNQQSKLLFFRELSAQQRAEINIKVSDQTIEKAIELLRFFKGKNIIADWVSATSDETIVFEIHTRVKKYVIEINEDEEIGFSSLDKTGGIAAESIRSFEDLYKRIEDYYMDFPGEFQLSN